MAGHAAVARPDDGARSEQQQRAFDPAVLLLGRGARSLRMDANRQKRYVSHMWLQGSTSSVRHEQVKGTQCHVYAQGVLQLHICRSCHQSQRLRTISHSV